MTLSLPKMKKLGSHLNCIRYMLSALIFAFMLFYFNEIRNQLLFYGNPESIQLSGAIKRNDSSIWLSFVQIGFKKGQEYNGFFVQDRDYSIKHRLFSIVENGMSLPKTHISIEPFDIIKSIDDRKPSYKIAIFSLDGSFPGKIGKQFFVQWPWVLRIRWLIGGYILLAAVLFLDVFLKVFEYIIVNITRLFALYAGKISLDFSFWFKRILFAEREGTNVKRNYWLYAMCIVVVVCMAVLNFIYGASIPYSQGDALSYQAQARSVVERGIFMPKPMLYADLSPESIDRYIDQPTHQYPNKGFILGIAFISWLRNDFNQINAHILNFFMTVGLAIALYGIGYSISKNYLLAILLPVAVLFHRIVLATAYNETTEQGFLCFVAFSIWMAIIGRTFTAGLFLGLGVFYREQSVLFVPFIIFLSSQIKLSKESIKGILLFFIGLSFGVIAYYAVTFFMASDSNSFYGNNDLLVNWFKKIKIENLNILPNYGIAFIQAFSPVLIAFFGYFIVTYRHQLRISKVLFLMCVGIYLASAFLLFPFPAFRLRFAVSSIMILWIIVFITANRYRCGALFFSIILVLNFIFQIPASAWKWRDWFADPVARWEFLKSRQNSLRDVFKDIGSAKVVLGGGTTAHVATRFFEKPIVFSRPKYDDFLEGENNHLIDAIIYVDFGGNKWPVLWDDEIVDYIEDHRGVRFMRIPAISHGQALRIMGRTNCFVRIRE